MTRKCIEPAQQSGRGRTESYNRTADRQSQHASSTGSRSDARDALAVVPHQGPRTSRTPRGTDNTSRESEMSRTHRESRRGTTTTGRDPETSRDHRDSRISRGTNSSSRDLEPSGSHRPSQGSGIDTVRRSSRRIDMTSDSTAKEVMAMERDECEKFRARVRSKYVRNGGRIATVDRDGILEVTPEEEELMRQDARDKGREGLLEISDEELERKRHAYDELHRGDSRRQGIVALTHQATERMRRENPSEVRRANPEDYTAARHEHEAGVFGNPEAFLLSLSPDEPGHCWNRSCSCGNILFTDLELFIRAHPDFPYPNRD